MKADGITGCIYKQMDIIHAIAKCELDLKINYNNLHYKVCLEEIKDYYDLNLYKDVLGHRSNNLFKKITKLDSIEMKINFYSSEDVN